MNFTGKKGYLNIQLSTKPEVEPGYSGLGGRDFTTAPTPIKRVLAVFFIENSAFYINNNNKKEEEEEEL